MLLNGRGRRVFVCSMFYVSMLSCMQPVFRAEKIFEKFESSDLNSKIQMDKAYNGDFLIDENGTLCNYKGSDLNVVVPDNVKVIGAYAFANHREIKSIKLPSKLVAIEHYAFSGCKELENIKVPDSVEIIDRLAFSGCENLKAIYIGEHVKRIGQMCFLNCSSLKKIEVNIKNETFASYKGVLYDKDYNTLIECPQGFEGKFIAFKKVKKVCDYAFAGCKKLNKIVFKDGVEDIGKAAFFNCSSLMTVYLGNDVISIGSCAFANCELLDSINIPETVKCIDSSAFYYCRSLNKIVITSRDAYFGVHLFNGCNINLKIYGYDESTIQKYADKEKIEFITIKQ